MSEYKTQLKTSIILLSISLFSTLYMFFNFDKIFTDIVVDIALLFSVFFFIFFYVIFRRFIVEFTYDLDEKRQKERNIRDCYLYNMLLNPPEENN